LRTVLLISPIIIILLFSCKKESGNPAGDLDGIGVIFPLNNGNYWIYRHTLLDSLMNVTGTWFDTVTINGPVSIDGEEWYGTDSADYVLTNRDDGLYMLDTLDPSILPQLVYKYPGRPGDSWKNDILSDTTTLISTVNRIFILNETYTFYRYRINNGSGYNEITAVPGLGLVYEEHFTRNSGSRNYYKSEQVDITAYHLK
jgi:hypothetical protein